MVILILAYYLEHSPEVRASSEEAQMNPKETNDETKVGVDDSVGRGLHGQSAGR
jgi:hypothetical protein